MNAYKSIAHNENWNKTNTVTRDGKTIMTSDDNSVAIPRRNEIKLDAAKIAKAQADARWIMSKFGK